MLKAGDRFIIFHSDDVDLVNWYAEQKNKVLIAKHVEEDTQGVWVGNCGYRIDLGEVQKLYKATCCKCGQKFLSSASIAQSEFGMLDAGHERCPKCNESLNLTYNPETETIITMGFEDYLRNRNINKVKTFNSLEEIDFSDIKVPALVIYKDPKDYPDKCVARIWDMSIPAATNTIYIADSVNEIRKIIPEGATVIPRSEKDDNCVVETWML
jgi:hypothetical protein